MLTKVVLLDTAGQPHFKLDLPVLRVGDPLKLKGTQSRKNAGRQEVLAVEGVYRVEQFGVDAASPIPCQILKVVSATSTPAHWVAVKKPDVRKLAPTHPGRTDLSEVYPEVKS